MAGISQAARALALQEAHAGLERAAAAGTEGLADTQQQQALGAAQASLAEDARAIIERLTAQQQRLAQAAAQQQSGNAEEALRTEGLDAALSQLHEDTQAQQQARRRPSFLQPSLSQGIAGPRPPL